MKILPIDPPLDARNAIEYFNLQLVIPNQVYSPSDDTDLSIFFLKKWIQTIEQSPFTSKKDKTVRIFEMGIGSGVLSLYLTSRLIQKGYIPEVIGVDINPIAVETANFNAELNHLSEKMTFLQGEFFNPLLSDSERNFTPFDFIISNPPYLAGEPQVINEENKQPIDYAWEGGLNGYEVTLDFLDQVDPFLASPGDFMLISSSNVDQNPIITRLEELDIKIIEILRTHKFFEDILLYHGRKEN
ncbi:MAG: hypothetical protein DRO88_02865 [Promethearchaeia archaeon]|nr:MAG: hypothetical protein DRO88_02865 [Candidatus Lokiarchaeia archaeon]